MNPCPATEAFLKYRPTRFAACRSPRLGAEAALARHEVTVCVISSRVVHYDWGRNWFRLGQPDSSITCPTENVKCCVVTRPNPNQQISSLASPLEQRFCLEHFFARFNNEDVVSMHCPRTGTRLISEIAARHIPTTSLQLTSLNSSLHDAAAGRVHFGTLRSFLTCETRTSAGTWAGDSTKVSLFSSASKYTRRTSNTAATVSL